MERLTDGVNFTQIATPGAGVTTFSNTGLAASTTFTYCVRAYNGAGDSDPTNDASATTQTSAPPAAPDTLGATASSQINLSWADRCNNETGFFVERSTARRCILRDRDHGSQRGLSREHRADCGDCVQFPRPAYDTDGDSAYSNVASASTPSAGSRQLHRLGPLFGYGQS